MTERTEHILIAILAVALSWGTIFAISMGWI